MTAKRIRRLPDVIVPEWSWEEALNRFLAVKKAQGASSGTLDSYRSFIGIFFRRHPDAWMGSTLRDCIIQFMGQGIKPATYNLRLIYLRAFFDWCIEQNLLAVNPLADFKKRKAQSRIVDIAEDDLRALLAAPDKTTFVGLRDYAIMLLTLDTGVRPKEAFALRIEHIDTRRNLVGIPPEAAKTRVGRSLPILPITAETLERLIRVRPTEWGKDVPVLCSSEGHAMNRLSWGDRLELYSAKIGVKIRPYDLRHSFALIYLRSGGHAFGLQKTMGHSDMNMTRRYVNLTGADLIDAHNTASPLNRLAPRKTRAGKLPT